MADEPVRVGIVVALREERVAVESAVRMLGATAQAGVRVLQGGLGGAMAGVAARKLMSNSPSIRLLVSCGFSGGLIEGLSVGAVFLATAVKARPSLEQAAQHDELLSCSDPVLSRTDAAFSAAALPFSRGVLVTLVQPVLSTADKRALGESSAAQAVDMEAAAVARVAREAGTGFVALRVISDGVNDALPPEVSAFLDERGRLRTGQVLKFAVGGPSNLKELWRLKSRSDRAASALEAALRVAIPAWLQGDC